jgi:predicted RNA binding protein YcfA (HicA-like mRNA interferase family)
VSKLPSISGRDCVRALAKAGFSLRQHESSHMILRRDTPFAQVVVPDHRELDRGTLRAILRQAAIEVSEFIALFEVRACVAPSVVPYSSHRGAADTGSVRISPT